MVDNEKYMNFLKSIISCVSYGDYSSIKELSHLELEKMIKEEKETKLKIMDIKKNTKISQNKYKPLEKWEPVELKEMAEQYSDYMLNIIERNDNIKDLKKEAISIEEFIKNI